MSFVLDIDDDDDPWLVDLFHVVEEVGVKVFMTVVVCRVATVLVIKYCQVLCGQNRVVGGRAGVLSLLNCEHHHCHTRL
jgi:hypothetical protein